MRHGVKINHLGRTTAHRHSLLVNLSKSLIESKTIITTLPKAKELRKFFEPLVTKSKEDTTHSRRLVFSVLQDKESVKSLFSEVAPQVSERNGGYLRILKLGPRRGDGAEMALIELVDFNLFLSGSLSRKAKDKKDGSESKKTRRSRSRKANTTAPAVA